MNRSQVILGIPSRYIPFRNWIVPQAMKRVPQAIRTQLAAAPTYHFGFMMRLKDPFIDHPGTLTAVPSQDAGPLPTFAEYYSAFAPAQPAPVPEKVIDAQPSPADAVESEAEESPENEEDEEDEEKDKEADEAAEEKE